MTTKFLTLRQALEDIGFKSPQPEKKSIDDGDFDDDDVEHQYQERRRLFTI